MNYWSQQPVVSPSIFSTPSKRPMSAADVDQQENISLSGDVGTAGLNSLFSSAFRPFSPGQFGQLHHRRTPGARLDIKDGPSPLNLSSRADQHEYYHYFGSHNLSPGILVRPSADYGAVRFSPLEHNFATSTAPLPEPAEELSLDEIMMGSGKEQITLKANAYTPEKSIKESIYLESVLSSLMNSYSAIDSPSMGQVAMGLSIQQVAPVREGSEPVERAMSPKSKAAVKDFIKEFRKLERATIEEARTFAHESLRMIPKSAHWRIHLELADFSKRLNYLEEAANLYETVTKLEPTASQGIHSSDLMIYT